MVKSGVKLIWRVNNMKNKKIKLLVLLLAVALIFGACSSQSENSTSSDSAVDMDMAMDKDDNNYEEPRAESMGETLATGSDAVPTLLDEKIQDKIIYFVNMNLISDDTTKTNELLTQKAIEMGGYIGHSNMYKSDGYSTYSLLVRVPSKSLDALMKYAGEISEVDYSNMSSDNITDQYYDIMQRLEHEKMEAVQLEEILLKAKTIEDILLVRGYLNDVQENIEVYEGRIRLWNSQVDYSTIDFNITQTPSIITQESGPRFITLGETGQGMVNVFKKSAIVVANFFSFVLRVISALIIPALIIAPIVLFVIYLVRRSKKRQQNKE